MEEQFQITKNELSKLSIKDLFFKYIRFIPLFIISVALSLLVAYLYLRYATLVYQSVGTMIIKDDQSSGAGSGDKFEELFISDGKKNIQNEIEYLQSRPLMERVVKALNLNISYYAKGNIKELNIYNSSPFRLEVFEIYDSSSSFSLPVHFENETTFSFEGQTSKFTFGQVFKDKYGVFRLVRNPAYAIGKDYRVTWEPTYAVAASILGSLAVAPKQNTGIVILQLSATNAQLAADIINQLMDEYKLATVEDKNDATRKTLSFIDDRLRVVQHEVDSINDRRVNYMRANNIYDLDAQLTTNIKRIEDATNQLQSEGQGLVNAEFISNYLMNRQNARDPVPSSLGIEDPTLNQMISGYNVAQLARKKLLENAPEGNVAVQQKEQEIELLRQKILENIRTLKSSYQSSISSVKSINSQAQSQVKALPEKQLILSEIQRSLSSKLFVYNSLLEKREESAIALAATISNIKELQDAQPNTVPIKPNRKSAQVLAILIGLLLPALFIFIAELLNDKITTRNDIERITTATILGEVGHSFNKETLIVTQNNRSVIAEQFRILRSNLQYILTNINKPVILVTSSFSGEGKSFVSTNVGSVLALAGKKTIILEFDIRKPKILSQLHMGKKPGLTNYLLGKIKLEDLPISVSGHEGLYVLSCGPVPPNPAELLLDSRLNDLFVYLRNNFDVVVMDTAPVGMVSDAMTLSKFADCTLYIVRQGHTYKKQIGMIDEFFQENKLPKISLVLNDVKIRSGFGYYGYGRYSYGYGYGSGYFEEDTPPASRLQRMFWWLDLRKWGKKK
ncbi:MAG TPA: polysaccharide biosynthesis tyrosine autokinase [Flavisolibacter sp.]|jgi:capsular exopolysaccharide synthesis family protein|nr:polysaccharide biosynthesis tyrosine autokinase [Flavisolibacter sp.]